MLGVELRTTWKYRINTPAGAPLGGQERSSFPPLLYKRKMQCLTLESKGVVRFRKVSRRPPVLHVTTAERCSMICVVLCNS